MRTLNRAVSFVLIFLSFIGPIQLLGLTPAYAGLFGGSIPKGIEVKDSYLEQLFAPEFPYESIKIIDTEKGKRYVVIKATKKVTEERRIDYEKNTLRNRGIVVYRAGSPRTDRLLISEMRLYRVVSEVPYVVEYCEVKAGKSDSKDEVENVVRDDGRYLIVLINKDFGKVFKRVEIYPEKETPCPDPPFVGKYPNARSISCSGGDKGITFVFVTKDNGQHVYDYYKDRLKSHYKAVGFNFPEESWNISGALHNLGMRIKTSEIAKIESYLNPAREKTSIIKIPQTNGMIFNIEITQIGLKPSIKDYSLIRIFYSTDRKSIDESIESIKKLYPEGIK